MRYLCISVTADRLDSREHVASTRLQALAPTHDGKATDRRPALARCELMHRLADVDMAT